MPTRADAARQLLHKVLAMGDPTDLSRFSQTCSSTRAFCDGDYAALLWKELYLSLFDPPAPAPTDETPYDYRAALKERIRARQCIASTDDEVRSASFNSTAAVLVELASVPVVGVSKNEAFIVSALATERNKAFYLHRDFVTRTPDFISLETIQRDQLASHLHVLHTPTDRALGDPRVRARAREVVYDRRNWLKRSQYGPFQNAGTGFVDWRKLEALSVVMGNNIQESITLGWAEDGSSCPSGFASTRPGPGGKGRDWAGVESHEWRGTYSFLDFRSWDEYNFHRQRGQLPSLEDESEAVGDCMSLVLTLLPEGERIKPNQADVPLARARVVVPMAAESDEDDEDDLDYRIPASVSNLLADTRTADAGSRSARAPAPFTSAKYPRLSFVGTLKNTFGNRQQGAMPHRSIRGEVEMTRDGFVHWMFIIDYSGDDQWLMYVSHR